LEEACPEPENQPRQNHSQDYASTIGSGPEESVVEVDVSADIAPGVVALDITELNKVSLMTCKMRHPDSH
jgi:hypothetical protein